MKGKQKWCDRFCKIKELGNGGNATVYHVKELSTKKEFALKELTYITKEKKQRFIDEIRIAKDNASTISGIIPIISSFEKEYWYTMPIAEKILDKLNNMSIKQIVSGVIELSETLERLHQKKIYHRDIKPSNIYIYNNRFFIGDFGLVDFPDKIDDFTQSDRPLGAIFTIAPEMKRNPKNADGGKADVFSLAKTMWMFLSGDEKGFDGVYNYLDPSHSLRYISKYKNSHLVEIDELLKDATENDPNIRPSIKVFKERLENWIIIYNDFYKSEASDWNFLKKQLFGSNPPESAKWINHEQIMEVLNTVGRTPSYNHMLFSNKGGLDFSHVELSNEKGCIYIYDKLGFCSIVKPKCLYYEGFNENYRWNYFLLELSNLNPILEENNEIIYEYLVEDKPAHYVSALDSQYGVYDYNTGVPLPVESKKVYRYMKGKFLIVMKNGPYNLINGTYDGRHGLCDHTNFRDYIGKLINNYSEIYKIVKQDEKFRMLKDHEIEKKILNSSVFNKNPFIDHIDSYIEESVLRQNYTAKQQSKEYLTENYATLNFKEIIQSNINPSSKIKFCFEFKIPTDKLAFDFFDENIEYVCINGYIKQLKSPLEEDCFYLSDREQAIKFQNDFQQKINDILHNKGLSKLEEYENCIDIKIIKCGKPQHLFTKQEIEEEMRNADDRVHNQLVIDEDGYAKVIIKTDYGFLFPVRHESWNAGNLYVGKYSKLLTLDEDYISSLQGWLSYLITGESIYMDYVHDNRNEEELIKEIMTYY